MEYYLIRKKFCELSGRYDLMNTDYTDNGADFFINAGQRYLDRLQNTGQMQAKYFQRISAGTRKVYVPGLRTVKEVWAGSSTDGLIQLSKASLTWLRQEYGERLGSVTQGTPEYYAPAIAGYYDIDDLILHGTVPNPYTYPGVIIAPPPAEEYYIIVYGLYYSPELSATLAGAVWTQTESIWSEVYPDILITAALYKLETFYRNTEGAKDWKAALLTDISDMDKDFAEEESAEINQIGG